MWLAKRQLYSVYQKQIWDFTFWFTLLICNLPKFEYMTEFKKPYTDYLNMSVTNI